MNSNRAAMEGTSDPRPTIQQDNSVNFNFNFGGQGNHAVVLNVGGTSGGWTPTGTTSYMSSTGAAGRRGRQWQRQRMTPDATTTDYEGDVSSPERGPSDGMRQQKLTRWLEARRTDNNVPPTKQPNPTKEKTTPVAAMCSPSPDRVPETQEDNAHSQRMRHSPSNDDNGWEWGEEEY